MVQRRDALKLLALGAGALVFRSNPVLAAADAMAGAPPAPAPAAPGGPFVLPPLPYAADALEPHLDVTTMTLHHDKHHAAYVANLNKAVAGSPKLQSSRVEDLLRRLDEVPTEVRTAIRNHGGGHANHSLLWTSLGRDGQRAPVGELGTAIDAAFGSFTAFQDKFNTAALGVFGSGWAWLTADAAKHVAIETSANQDNPLTAGRVPLLGIDVWEHAYYLKFQNRRAEYVAEFAKVVDWDVVSARYRDAAKG
jgi:superoxide dismutase, Fe-Mn family